MEIVHADTNTRTGHRHESQASRAFPVAGRFESTFAMFRDPYRFISRECRRLGSDVFYSRFLFQRTHFMTGRAAAEVFYDTKRFKRRGAAPEPLRATLLGKGGVQCLDGVAHHHRKQMFMALVTGVPALLEAVRDELNAAAIKWTARDSVKLYDEIQRVLTKSVCRWAGIDLKDADVKSRTHDLVAMFDAAGAKSVRHFGSRIARKRAESWIGGIVEKTRERPEPATKTPFECIVWHRDEHGHLLNSHVASVEVLNLLRPTVAVSAFIVFGAHAMHTHPESVTLLHEGKEENLDCFAQEVRRFYPFFPSAIAIVETNFEWRGHQFKKGERAILDLYGTNHDPGAWDHPNLFRPLRFRDRAEDIFGFIPQGGGIHRIHHRCPGENITVEIMKLVFKFLATRIRYDVLPQDIDIVWSRVPAVPRSRFMMSNVVLKAP